MSASSPIECCGPLTAGKCLNRNDLIRFAPEVRRSAVLIKIKGRIFVVVSLSVLVSKIVNSSLLFLAAMSGDIELSLHESLCI